MSSPITYSTIHLKYAVVTTLTKLSIPRSGRLGIRGRLVRKIQHNPLYVYLGVIQFIFSSSLQYYFRIFPPSLSVTKNQIIQIGPRIRYLFLISFIARSIDRQDPLLHSTDIERL